MSKRAYLLIFGLLWLNCGASWAEDAFACRDRTPYPAAWSDRQAALERLYARIIARAGPCLLVSAYRSPAHNKHVGGAKRSQHVQGRALDLKPLRISVARLAKIVREIPEVRGIGIYRSWVHVDLRPGKRVEWR